MLQLTLFGHFRAQMGANLLPFPTESTAALLAYLALERDQPQPRSYLATLLWPDKTDEQGRRNLRQTLLRLRQTVPETAVPLLLTTNDALQWNPDYPAWVDVYQFANAMAEAEPFLPNSPFSETPVPALARLRTAVNLYTAPLLSRFALDNDLYTTWLLPWRQKFQQQALHALARLAEMHGRAGDPQQMAVLAQRQINLAPERDEAHAQLLRAYLAQGELTAALNHYTAYRQQSEEYEWGPSAAVRQWYEMAWQQRQQSIPPAPPPPHSLPSDETPFFGRAAELEELRLRLAAPGQRLLTLTGLGGMGKTRLAIAVARPFARSYPPLEPRFPGGVWFVSLADVSAVGGQAEKPTEEDDLVAQAILAACGWLNQRGENPLTAVIRYLQNSPCLLILDNLEHLPRAPHIAWQLLKTVPDLTILATSRHRLGLQQEAVYPVQGLPVPQHDADTAVSSLALLIERMRRLDGSFQPDTAVLPHLVHICHILTGWPLALELAAGWAEVLAVAEIAGRVTGDIAALHSHQPDLPDRQRSLTAVLNGSYNLLPAAAQTALARFALLRGGCALPAGPVLLGVPIVMLDLLVRRALLSEQEGRYQIHELVRQFAATALADLPDRTAAESAHAHYYLDLVAGQTAALHGAEPLTAVLILRPEQENIFAAWLWAANHQPAWLREALAGLVRFFNLTGLWREGVRLLAESETAVLPPDLRHDLRLADAHLLLRLGEYPKSQALLQQLPPLSELSPHQQLYTGYLWLEWLMLRDDVSAARIHGQTALALAKELGEHTTAALILARLDMLHDYDTPYQAEALALIQPSADRWLQRFLHSFLGSAAIRHGRYEAAHTHWQTALDIASDFADWYTVASTHNNLGDVLRQLEQYELAEIHFREALTLYEQLHDQVLRMYPLEGWARLCVHRGAYAAAIPLAQESFTLAAAQGSQITQITALSTLGHAYAGLELWVEAQNCYADAASLLPELPRWGLEAVVGLAYVAWRQGNLPAARSHIHHFLQLVERCPPEGSSSPSLLWERVEKVLQALGEDTAMQQ
jgi:DNA-binding SARP family transcriptional activator/predicted ATPase